MKKYMIKHKSNTNDKQVHIVVGYYAVTRILTDTPRIAQELFLAITKRLDKLDYLQDQAYQIGIRVHLVNRNKLEVLAGGTFHQGVVLILISPLYVDLEQVFNAVCQAGKHALVILADHIQSPHNLGALIRSAAAVGAQGVVIPCDRACQLTPAVAKSAVGSLGLVQICRVNSLAYVLNRFKKIGLLGLATITNGIMTPWTLDLVCPLAVVVGSEHSGISRHLLKSCDMTVSLPLALGIDSLNVSVATGILLFEIIRQRLLFT